VDRLGTVCPITKQSIGWVMGAKPSDANEWVWPKNEPAAQEGALTEGEVESGLLRVR
jgi:hypothetical protein